jgi:hypothetical protein
MAMHFMNAGAELVCLPAKFCGIDHDRTNDTAIVRCVVQCRRLPAYPSMSLRPDRDGVILRRMHTGSQFLLLSTCIVSS